MSVEIVKSILENVLSREPKKHNNLCCVCLQVIVGDEKCSVQDDFEFTFDTGVKVVERLGTIIETAVGKSINDVSFLLNSVCFQCKDAALISYKFILGARESVGILSQVIEHLQICLMDTPESMLRTCKTMYLNIENDEVHSTVRRYYDKKHIENQKEALERINMIIQYRNSVDDLLISQDEDVLDNDKTDQIIEPSPELGLESIDLLKLDLQGEVLKAINQQLPDKTPKSNPRRLKLYNCPACKAGFNSLKHYERHRNSKRKCTYRKRGLFQCAHCKYNAVYKNSLRDHIRLKHPETTSIVNVVCEECGKFFPNKAILKRHKLTHSNKKKIECQECGKTLLSINGLKLHMALHTGEKNFACQFCDKRFRNHGNRYDHIHRHHMKQDPVQCEICQKVYKYRQDYLKHKRKHFNNTSTPKQKVIYQCDHCKFSATQKHVLKNHIQFKHEGTGGKMCDKCGKKFPKQSILNKHLESHKNMKWKHECQVCNQKFNTDILFKNHMQAQHIKVENLLPRPTKNGYVSTKGFKFFNCPDCNAGFNSPELYKKHKSAKRPCTKWYRSHFQCDKCDFTCTYKYILQRHVQVKHEGIGVTCEKCGKMFHNITALKTHQLTHSEEPRFKCEMCGQRLRSAQGLKNHMALHTGEKNYTCHICDKHFRSPANRYEHITRLHMPVNPAQCDICQKVFKYGQDYVRHKKNLHSKDSYFIQFLMLQTNIISCQ